MPNNTDNLTLYKIDPLTDGNLTFNIDDALNNNWDKIDVTFDDATGHKHTGVAGDAPKITSTGLAPGAATDTVIGNRTADPDTATAYGLSGTLTQMFSWVFKFLKSITGKANPFDAPAITLEATKAHVDDTAPHNATAAATPSRLMLRDAAGRAQVVAPAAAGDVAIRSTVDAAQAAAAVDATTKDTALQGVVNTALALKAPLASPVFSGVATFPTAASGTNTLQAANTAFVQAAIALLINSAPGALDTLNELAAAMGNDPNFAATVTNALALKLPTASYTATDILAKLLTVDGVGSGLDAGLFQGKTVTDFILPAALIPNLSNLDTFNTEGSYYMSGSPANITAITNKPPGMTTLPFNLQVINTGGTTRRHIFSTSSQTVVRTFERNSNGVTWGTWYEKENTSAKNMPNGYAGLDSTGRISGVPITRAKAQDVPLLIGSQTLLTYTPTVAGAYTVSINLDTVTDTTAVVNVTYTSRSGVHTVSILPSTLLAAGSSWSYIPLFISPTINQPITVTVTSTATGTIYATATIRED